MDKYIELLNQLPFDLLHISQSYAVDNNSPKIEPAHLLRALLHKKAGLVNFIEDTLNSDYYYLVDWSDMRMQQCDKSPYKMKGIDLSHDSKAAIKEALSISEKCNSQGLTAHCLLAAILTPGIAFSVEQLKTMPLSPNKIIESISGGNVKATEMKPATSDSKSQQIADYCIPMLHALPEAQVIGFEDKLRALMEVMARKDRANLLIAGEPGVGKTSLIIKLLQLIKSGDAPSCLSAMKPYELDLIALSQGVSYKGELEDRLREVLNKLSEISQPVMVIDNFHRIEDRQSILNGILPGIKKALSQGVVQLICTTSIDGFTKDIEKDKELLSFFEKITVDEPSEEEAVEIVKSKCSSYESFHNISADNDVPAEIVRLAKRYIPERRLPSSALDLLDRAMASTKIAHELSIGNPKEAASGNQPLLLRKEEIRDVVSKMTGIPMGNIQSGEREKLSNAEEILHRRVVGQNHAVKSILDAIYESRSGLNKKGQPMGSFFFLGPTGTGKTELAKSLAEFLFNDDSSILRFDMSEYKEEHSVALLYGAPPGYVGYEEGGLLVNQIRQHPYSVVLFDEIEKAHKSVFDLFLQILDEGKLHDRLGRVGDFSNALIIFTSNIGSDYIFKSFGEGKIPTHDQMLEVMQGQFRPEFLARLTEIVPFSPITPEMIDRIFDIHIKGLLKTLDEQGIGLEIDDSARSYVTKVGFNAHYGARPILGIIRKEIRRPLSKLIISGDIKPGDKVTMKYNDADKEICWEISGD